MMRTLLLLIAGIVGGSALVLVLGAEADSGGAEQSASHRSGTGFPGTPVTPTTGVAVPAVTSGFESERLAIYEQAARTTSPAELEALIETAAGQPRSRSRALQLEALLARLAELDAARAASLGEALALERELLASVYRIWAVADLAAALDAVGDVRSAVRQQAFALALLDGLGHDPDSVERVAEALPADRAPAGRRGRQSVTVARYVGVAAGSGTYRHLRRQSHREQR